MFQGPFQASILKKAQEKDLLSIEYINIRDFGIGKHKIVDDTPYGGGVGMVMRVDVVAAAIAHARCQTPCAEKVILLDAGGSVFTQTMAKTLTTLDHMILICGHYEGIDDRIRSYIDEELSIGDYILTGGEIPAMVIVDSVARLLPGVLGKDESSTIESFSPSNHHILEHPQFTRPESFEGKSVPEILTSGDHKKIAAWNKEQAQIRTQKKRPDLLKKTTE